ncbi:MAG TPA: thiazole synthase [bacterium]|nr:thiazole synthase [bacterium]HOB70424.1 thiazole synthase [bacterium]HOG44664.1 thiazole synthase [bacterium]HPY15583.1 thiazole synthase [bacterium]HQM84870.1 thiazole synthase [bacterium]
MKPIPKIGNFEINSRLFLGSGKYRSNEEMMASVISSGTQVVTASLRRMDLDKGESLLKPLLENKNIIILPNTAGARTAEEAVFYAELAEAAGLPKWVKLELTPEPRYLLPDPVETLKATEILVKKGFTVLPYINADPMLALRLQDAGAATVMPLGAPIGTNKGIIMTEMIRIIIEQARVPVVVDAGIGTPSDAAKAIEMGADFVLVNTAIATAKDPEKMGLAFKLAVEAATIAISAGIPRKYDSAQPSSPELDFINKL